MGNSIIYKAYFELTNPVINISEARSYLTDDDMLYYMDEDDINFKNAIESISWILETEDSGYIEVISSRELSYNECKIISDYIKGQNSDGLGEGFEQQDFAFYEDPENPGKFITASFDWKTNDYSLTRE